MFKPSVITLVLLVLGCMMSDYWASALIAQLPAPRPVLPTSSPQAKRKTIQSPTQSSSSDSSSEEDNQFGEQVGRNLAAAGSFNAAPEGSLKGDEGSDVRISLETAPKETLEEQAIREQNRCSLRCAAIGICIPFGVAITYYLISHFS